MDPQRRQRRAQAWHDVRSSPGAANGAVPAAAPAAAAARPATAHQPQHHPARLTAHAGGGFERPVRTADAMRVRVRPGTAGSRASFADGRAGAGGGWAHATRAEYVSLSGARVSFNHGGAARGSAIAEVDAGRDGTVVTRVSGGGLVASRTRQARESQPERINLDRLNLDACCAIQVRLAPRFPPRLPRRRTPDAPLRARPHTHVRPPT